MDDRNPTGYVVALPPEGRTLTSRPLRRGESLVLTGQHRIAVAGAGADNATRAAETLVALGARRLVSWGCAGALSDALQAGDLIMPRQLIASDGTTLDLASPWHEHLLAHLQGAFGIHTEPLVETPGILASATAKRRLHATTNAIAADMESVAVARVAQQRGLACLTVRSIVDAASVTLPEAAQVALDPNGEIVLSRLLLRLARRPAEIIPLMTLARAFRRAMDSLAAMARFAGPALEPR